MDKVTCCVWPERPLDPQFTTSAIANVFQLFQSVVMFVVPLHQTTGMSTIAVANCMNTGLAYRTLMLNQVSHKSLLTHTSHITLDTHVFRAGLHCQHLMLASEPFLRPHLSLSFHANYHKQITQYTPANQNAAIAVASVWLSSPPPPSPSSIVHPHRT